MTEIEKLTTLIGEFVAVEIDNVNQVEYANYLQKQNAFTIIMNDGRKYFLEIIEKKQNNNWFLSSI